MAADTAAATALESEEEPVSKRDAIIAGATEIFLGAGYGAASMDAIAQAAGVSKQTVYAHFGAKDTLFEAIIRQKCDDLLAPAVTVGTEDGDVGQVLHDIAERFVNAILSPENMKLFRAIVGESSRFPELADAFYRAGPRLAADVLADYLFDVDAKGELAVPNPKSSAERFFAMLRNDLYMRRVLGIERVPCPNEADTLVGVAVSAFIAAHRKT